MNMRINEQELITSIQTDPETFHYLSKVISFVIVHKYFRNFEILTIGMFRSVAPKNYNSSEPISVCHQFKIPHCRVQLFCFLTHVFKCFIIKLESKNFVQSTHCLQIGCESVSYLLDTLSNLGFLYIFFTVV